jgi:short-subunit dehydrogenase involved in D-alanine esterification of teichoic acids
MAPLYKKALIVGATSGIGEALATKLLAEGTSVIVTGRRQERLDDFMTKHSNNTSSNDASAYALDVTKLSTLPGFAADVLRAHPDLDCVVLNSGIQRAFDFARPTNVDLGVFGDELLTNYTSFVHLATAFLPHLQNLARSENKETHLVFMSAALGLVPFMVRTPGYNASKAALHSWITAVRQQLKDNSDRVRLVEVFPPAVQTELHDEKHQPDLQNGGEIGMPLAQYTDAMYAELVKGDEQFAIGPASGWLQNGFEAERQKIFEQQQCVLKQNLAKYLK